MPIKNFKDIYVWQKAHELTLLVYELTKKNPKEELFGLVSQIRRSAVSVPSNIVEGFKRNGEKDDKHFCNVAQASLEELKYQMFLSKDLKYLLETEYKKFESLSIEVSKLLHLWIKGKQNKY